MPQGLGQRSQDAVPAGAQADEGDGEALRDSHGFALAESWRGLIVPAGTRWTLLPLRSLVK